MSITMLDGYIERTQASLVQPFVELVRTKISLDLTLVAAYREYLLTDRNISSYKKGSITQVFLQNIDSYLLIAMSPRDFAALLPGGGVTLPSIGLYAQTQQGPIVTNTEVETSIIGSGVGGLTIPANTFKVGDSYHGKIGGVISTLNNHEITINAKADGSILTTTGLISLEAATAQSWEMEVDFTIAEIGAVGTVKSNGNFIYNRNTGSYVGVAFNDTEVLDTTIDQTLDILVQWNQRSSSDIIFTHQFVLYKIY